MGKDRKVVTLNERRKTDREIRCTDSTQVSEYISKGAGLDRLRVTPAERQLLERTARGVLALQEEILDRVNGMDLVLKELFRADGGLNVARARLRIRADLLRMEGKPSALSGFLPWKRLTGEPELSGTPRTRGLTPDEGLAELSIDLVSVPRGLSSSTPIVLPSCPRQTGVSVMSDPLKKPERPADLNKLSWQEKSAYYRAKSEWLLGEMQAANPNHALEPKKDLDVGYE